MSSLVSPFQFPSMRTSTRAVLLGIAANALWGTSFLAGQFGVRLAGPIVTTVLAFAAALGVLALSAWFSGRTIHLPRGRQGWFAALSVGITGFGMFYPFLYAGLARVSSGRSAAILLSSPLMTLLMGLVFLGERASWRKGLAIVVGILGCGILILPDLISGSGAAAESSSELWGELLTLAAAASLAASIVLTRKYSDFIEPYDLTFWSIATGLLVLLPLLGSQTKPIFEWVPLLAIFYSGAVCTALCCLLWNRALALAPAKVVAPTMYIKTPVAILIGTLWMRESFTWSLAVGSMLVLGSILISESDPIRD